MKNVIILILMMAWIPGAHGEGPISAAPTPAQSNASGTLSLANYLNYIAAYDLDQAQVKKSILAEDSECGKSYYLDIVVHGFWGDVQANVDFYVQTLTQESQDRLYNAIKANYATQGLPPCLLQDQFAMEGNSSNIISFEYGHNPDITTVQVPVVWMHVPSGYPCAGNFDRPLTSCWNVADPYGK